MAGIDDDTILMLHMNVADTSTTFTDSSDSGHTATANGDAQIDTALSKFGGAAGIFDATGDFLEVTGSLGEFDLAGNNFTIDFWLYATGFPAQFARMIDFKDDSGSRVTNLQAVQLTSGGDIQFFEWTGGNSVSASYSSFLNQWTHVAIVGDVGDTVKIYLDGVEKASATVTSEHGGIINGCRIGETMNNAGYFINASLDEFRISTVKRWTSTPFTVPAAEYTDERGNAVFPLNRSVYPIDKVPPAALVW